MTTLSIVTKNLRKRLLGTVLTTLSITLGVGLIVAILTIQTETEESFNQTSAGYDLILAAKGSQLQSTLNTLYHIETSTGIVPYALYEATQNDPRVEYSFPFYVGDSYRQYRVIGTSTDYLQKAQPRRDIPFTFRDGRNFETVNEAVLGSMVADQTGMAIGDTFYFTHGVTTSDGVSEEFIHEEHPVTIVGILSPSGTANDRAIFAAVQTTHLVHAPYQEMAVAVDQDSKQNGDPAKEQEIEKEQAQQAKGTIEKRDTTLVDSANVAKSPSGANGANVSKGSIDALGGKEGDNSKNKADGESAENTKPQHEHAHSELIAVQVKNLDAVLVKFKNPASALQVSGMINYPVPANPIIANNLRRDPLFQFRDGLMAVSPAMQISQLMKIVGNVDWVLRAVAVLVVIVALFGIIVAIYNTMEERKRDIAIMRALGASRGTIMRIIIIEAAFICFFGIMFGLMLGWIATALIAPYLIETAGIFIKPFAFSIYHGIVLAILFTLGIIAGVIPALKAYKTDVAAHLTPQS